MPCSLSKGNRLFGETRLLHLQCRREKNQHDASSKQGKVLLGLRFNSEDGGDMFLRNVGCHSTDYTELYAFHFRIFQKFFI
jgi:hypothetical protein